MLDNSIYNIIKDLFGLNETNGLSETEIEQVRRLYKRIPFALELYYREVGRDERINNSYNNLILPHKHPWAKCESYLIIYAEHQGVCFWGISLNDLENENPPVYVTFDNVDKKIWKLESYKLSDFLVAMAYVHAGFSLPFISEEIELISESEANVIRKSFQRKCEPLMEWVDGGVEFYGSYFCDSIVLIRNVSDYDLYYASGKESCFNEMREILSTFGKAY